MRALLIVFILGLVINSEAQLRCFDLFAQSEVNSPAYFAEVIDTLNSRYNDFLFDNSLTDKLNPEQQDTWTAQVRARYQAFKLRRHLKDLKSTSYWDRYDYEVFAVKLEQLTFLADLSVTKKMSKKDKALYLQVRHSILAKGLENFFFADSNASVSTRKKVFTWVMSKISDKYIRWTYAYVMAPKLRGAVLPLEIAEKIAWEGLDKNRDLLKPYEKHTLFKAYFNVFSSAYNWTLVSALVLGVPTAGYLTYSKMEETGTAQAVEVLTPMHESAKAMAETDYHQLAQQKDLQNILESFRAQFNREPNKDEWAFILKQKAQ